MIFMFRLGDYKVLRGQNASQGIGIGTAYLYEEIHIEIPEEFVGSPDDALSRFQKKVMSRPLKKLMQFMKRQKKT